MKRTVLLLTCLILITSCTSTKTTTTAQAPVTPAGEWEYSVKDTPEGDFSGIMTISQKENSFSAVMNSNGNDLHFDSFTWDEPNKKAGGEFYYSGTPIYFEATMDGEELTGSMSAGGMVFPFKATRKK